LRNTNTSKHWDEFRWSVRPVVLLLNDTNIITWYENRVWHQYIYIYINTNNIIKTWTPFTEQVEVKTNRTWFLIEYQQYACWQNIYLYTIMTRMYVLCWDGEKSCICVLGYRFDFFLGIMGSNDRVVFLLLFYY